MKALWSKFAVSAVIFWCPLAGAFGQGPIRDLPSSKRLGPVAGNPQRVNAMPAASAVSPDGSRVAFVHTGYGSNANENRQSITLVETATGKITEYNEAKLKLKAKQTFSFGVAFSDDGRHLYVPFGSSTDPGGNAPESTGNAIGVYAVGAKLQLERFIPLPVVELSKGKSALELSMGLSGTHQTPFPAGIAVFARDGREKLMIAEQLSDTVAIVDTATGRLESRIEVGGGKNVPSAYPYGAVVKRRGDVGYVSLWNGSEVVEIDLRSGRTARRFPLLPSEQPTGAGSHPTAMMLSPDQKTLYVALANRDQVASIQLESGEMKFEATTPAIQKYVGAYPVALAITADGGRLFVANSSQDSVAILSTKKHSLKYLGALPTQWYPSALAVSGQHLFIGTAKGVGTGPNGAHDPASMLYSPKIGYGSIAQLNIGDALRHLKDSTRQVIESNRYGEAQEAFRFAGGKNPIKHVIYVIKENRTYDQVFGDVKEANGDPGLVMFGEDVTPNQHALARQFGVLDNFYDSGEVSGNGHVWSTAAITSDYTEKIWPITYRGDERTYDFEGNVSNSVPMLLGIPDVNEPSTGYLWTNLARNHRTYRHYGEFIESIWCSGGSHEAPEAGEESAEAHPCPINRIEKGMPLPGSGVASPYPWKVPVLFKDNPSKPELAGHFDPNFADFELDYPDQLRADEFLREFKGFVSGGDLPEFILLRLPNDHTSGTKAGMPTPRAAVADNDLAVGRVVEAVSHSPYWGDTAIFVLEDDAQSGADHVDAHRSIALVISKYSPRTQDAKPFVESGFYTTVNMVHTMEALLGLPPMNANDAYAPIMYRMFSGPGEQQVFQADQRNLENGLLYEVNTAKSPGAKESAKLDFTHADAADAAVLNRVLWRAVKGKQPMPKPVYRVFPRRDD